MAKWPLLSSLLVERRLLRHPRPVVQRPLQAVGPAIDRRFVLRYTRGVLNHASMARELIRIVETDTGLTPETRRKAHALDALAESQSDLALERLDKLCEEVRPTLPVDTPAVDYARCVDVEAFWRYHLKSHSRAIFIRVGDYRAQVESDPDPSARLLADFNIESFVPAANSWLAPLRDLNGLTGEGMKDWLKLRADPPYVVLVLSVERMHAKGVAVRRPRGVDAIPGRHLKWYSGNVPDERIDQDIPASAVERIEWRL